MRAMEASGGGPRPLQHPPGSPPRPEKAEPVGTHKHNVHSITIQLSPGREKKLQEQRALGSSLQAQIEYKREQEAREKARRMASEGLGLSFTTPRNEGGRVSLARCTREGPQPASLPP